MVLALAKLSLCSSDHRLFCVLLLYIRVCDTHRHNMASKNCNAYSLVGMTIHIEDAMYGRLEEDDGSEGSCTYGKGHKGKTDCQAASR